ncbi:hypothetical protein [Sabulibacter ruber]|uniref:hypothetical protein n=1 Tax=Sabulibacter ruber TaxID=2811901 RepID=UPI001A96B2D7|nr:hypothetical protein [Sabulibacter ruber]
MKQLSGLFLVILLGACGQPQKKEYVVQVASEPLPEKDFYHPEIVYDVVFDSEELASDSVKRQSRQLFLEAIDFAKNKKNPAEAIPLFKQSIRLFPEAKTYYELGYALLEVQHKDEEALKAFEVAEYLQFKPVAGIYFGKALAHSRLYRARNPGSQERYNSELMQALNAGFSDTAQILRYPTLRQDFQSADFQYALAQVKISRVKEKAGDLYSLFLKSFQSVKQPFEIAVEKVDMKQYNRSISYDFAKYIPEMQNTSFGRDVSHDFFFVGKVAETPAYTAVVYSSVNFYGEEMQPVLTKLVTYDPKGKLISNLLFSCQCSAEKVKKGRVENNLITLEDFKRIWKHPIDKVGFENNQVLKYEPLATATYRITETGTIVEEAVPANYKDSGILASRH